MATPEPGTTNCCVEGCTRKAVYKASELCSPCYQFFYRWKKASVTEFVGHAKKLRFWDLRADGRLHGLGVSNIQRKRRAK